MFLMETCWILDLHLLKRLLRFWTTVCYLFIESWPREIKPDISYHASYFNYNLVTFSGWFILPYFCLFWKIHSTILVNAFSGIRRSVYAGFLNNKKAQKIRGQTKMQRREKVFEAAFSKSFWTWTWSKLLWILMAGEEKLNNKQFSAARLSLW